MAGLSGNVKVFIVERLACFDAPTEVRTAVKQEFGVDVSLPRLTAYNPTKASGQRLSNQLKVLFEATRKRFLEDTASIPLVHQNYRLHVLQRQLKRADAAGNASLVMQLLEQAAKEVGGMFTNRRELTGKDGKPLVPAAVGPLPTDPIEAAAVYQQYMQGG
jgi:hypothetical protein